MSAGSALVVTAHPDDVDFDDGLEPWSVRDGRLGEEFQVVALPS